MTPSRPFFAPLLLAALAASACDRQSNSPGPSEPDSTASWPVATALPVLRITTTGGAAITSTDTYVQGSITLTDSGAAAATPLTATTDVRGHGNSTWSVHPKKPYRLRLTTAASLLGMPSNRHWVLLANHSDKTLIRTDVSFELSRRMGWPWTPRTQHVDLYLNDTYQGMYQIAEHVRLGADRINVPTVRVGDTTAALITGSYLIEIDETRGEAFCFTTTRTPKPFCLKDPETLLEPAWAKQREYIVGYINGFEAALYGAQFADPTVGYAAWIDVASAVDYYLLQELVKNVDSNLRRGTYLTKPRGEKLVFGPNWDFDLAIGNANYDGADRVDGWHTRQGAWYVRLFQDPAFDARVRARWKQLRDDGTITDMIGWSSRRRRLLGAVQTRNFDRWPILSVWVWPNRVVTGSYGGEVMAMQDWYWARMRWMDAQLGY